MSLLSISQLHTHTFAVLFRDSRSLLQLWLASPSFSRLLTFSGSHSLPDAFIRTAGVTLQVKEGTFALKKSLRGGGCNLGRPGEELEPEVPLSSAEQRDATEIVKEMHEKQANEDYISAYQTDQRLGDFLSSDLHHPFAVLRTLLEAYTSLDWSSQTCTLWLLLRIKALLDQIYLTLVLEGKAISAGTKQYLKQLVAMMTKEDPDNEKLGLYMRAYGVVIESGLETIARTQFIEDVSVRKQIMRTLQMLKGKDVPISEVFLPSTLAHHPSIFQRALSLELALYFPFANPNSIDYLLSYLQRDTAAPWPLVYIAMLKLVGLVEKVDEKVRKKIVEGDGESRGLMQMMEEKEREDGWVLRCAAFHALTTLCSLTSDSLLQSAISSLISQHHSMETDPRVLSFHRQAQSLLRLTLPSTLAFLESPLQQLCTLCPAPGRAHIAVVSQRAIGLFEKDFIHSTARVVLTKCDLAIITGGMEHPTHSYEVSLNTGEYLRMAELGESRHIHAGALLDNTVYISGGRGSKGDSIASTECYKGGKWDFSAALNHPRDTHSMTSCNHRLYVAGGSAEDTSLLVEVLWEACWTVLPVTLPEPRTSPGFLFVTSQTLVVFGGFMQKARKEAWEVDIVTGKIKQLLKMPISATFPSNSVVIRNQSIWGLSCDELEMVEMDLIEGVWRVWDNVL